MWDQIKQVIDISNWELAPADIGVLAGYFILMIAVGFLCRKISTNISDYIRMGAKGTWWLAGLSVFMQTFSAAAFTGYCGQAFLAGWSVLLVFWGNALMFILQGTFFAPWLRQTRAITPADANRLRYGPVIEQVVLYLGLPGGLCWGGMFLLTLSIFLSAMFGLPLYGTLVVMAVIIIFYSVSGGSWSVQITDTLQSFILVPVTIAVAGLCLIKLGDGNMFTGVGNMMDMIKAKGLSEQFQIIKPDNFEYPSYIDKGIGKGYFTLAWVIATVFNAIIASAQMGSCYRYLSVKNGKDARKAAYLAAILMIIGSFVWFIPPVTGRLLYEKEILALSGTEVTQAVVNDVQIDEVSGDDAAAAAAATDVVEKSAKPKREKLKSASDGAYAYVAKQVLPPGMLGLVLIAMASAAMSSMDSNLTGTAGLFTNNMYPPLARLFGCKPATGKPLLLATKIINFLLGCWALFMAHTFYQLSGEKGIFSMMLDIISFIGAPVGMPMIVSFFCKKVPWWSVIVGMAFGWMASIILMFGPAEHIFGLHNIFGYEKVKWFEAPAWHWRIFIMFAATVTPTVLMRVFWFTAKEDYRKRVDNFFRTIKTPIDFEKEVGQEEDHSQLLLVGTLSMITGALLMILIIYGRDLYERGAAAFVALFVLGLGLLLYFTGRSKQKKLIAAGLLDKADHDIVPHTQEHDGQESKNE